MNNLLPQYLTDMVPPVTRSAKIIHCGLVTTSHHSVQIENVFLDRIFRPQYVTGTIRPCTLDSDSLNGFTVLLDKHIEPPVTSPWYGYGKRFGDVHHTRMRMGHSMLKHDLHFNLHVDDSPLCTYHPVVEDAHYLFCNVLCILYR